MLRLSIPTDRPASLPRTAVPVFRGRVSPVLDTCTRLCLLESDGKQANARRTISVTPASLLDRVREIQKLGIGVIICGAVSDSFYNLLRDADIDLICGITGDIDEVIDAYRRGTLDHPCFRMPGSD
jgi:predicted Fe-Mo cluster-binding NifX family protein